MKKQINLQEAVKILKDNKQILLKEYGVLEIAVFGSLVRNEQKQKSDIDIFVDLKPRSKTFDNFMELKFFLEQLTSKKVDLVVKSSIRKELKPMIFKEAVYA